MNNPKSQTAPSHHRITREEIAHTVGEISDAKIVAIISSGASLKELEEAVAWASAESDVMGELERPLAGPAARVYDILTAEEEPEEERD
ncbi:MAG: hypothetical protein MI806_31475 [Minwuiales bacterium]|nr:hypothetical protein [Minwuiales bacterium]